MHLTPFAGVKCVDDLDLGHLDVAIARQQFHQSVFPFKCIVIDLYSRCCRAQYGLGSMHLSQHQSCVASVIARCRVLLFVAAVMLLIHNDQTEVGVGEKYR